MKKSIIIFALALAFFLCSATAVAAVETPVSLSDDTNADQIQGRAATVRTTDITEKDVHVIFLPIDTVGYTVTPVSEGMVVEHGESYSFKVTVNEGYVKDTSFSVKVNGEKLFSDGNGIYTIPSVVEECIVTVEGVADIMPPDVKLQIGDYFWTELPSETEEFMYIDSLPTIKVDASDVGREAPAVQIAISSFELSESELYTYVYWQKYEEGMTLSGDGANFVYVKATDKAGNTSYAGSVGIVCDTSAPSINVNDGETYYGTKSIKISDDYLVSITLDGKPSTPSFTLVPRDKDYEIVATDKAGNKTSVTVSIKRAVPTYTAPTDLSAILGQTLADIKLPSTENGSFVWSLPLSTSVGELGENKFYVAFIPTNTAYYQTITGIEVVVKVTNKAHNPPVGLSSVAESIKGIADGKITGVSDAMEYRGEGDSEWIQVAGTEITGLVGGTYYVRYSASVGYEASSFVAVSVASGRMLKVTFLADGEIVEVVETAYGQPLVDIPTVPVKVGYNHATPYWDVSDFSFITEDMTVNAVYMTNTYIITFSQSPRYTVREGSIKNPVEYGSDYTFYIDIGNDYMKGIYFTVKNNGALILPDADGMYTIKNVTEVHNIEISGVVLNVSADKNTVVGIDDKKHYAIGDKLSFEAIGSGMSNNDPEIGDERYVPVSWTGYLTSRWDSAPYKASFTLYKEGECQLNIVYRHEIYSANGWIPYGESEQSVHTVTVHKLPYGIPTGNVTLSTVVCAVLIVAFTGVFIAWYVVKKKRENNGDSN